MDIDIDRKSRHVTISMAGYIDKLFQSIRPNGTKGASTPSTYAPPNYKSPGAQTATIGDTPLATLAQKKELQSVIGTLLYYSQTVDPSILTAVHELGSVQANPTIKDIFKMERLLQYLSTPETMASAIMHQICSCKSNPTRSISADPGPDQYQEDYST